MFNSYILYISYSLSRAFRLKSFSSLFCFSQKKKISKVSSKTFSGQLNFGLAHRSNKPCYLVFFSTWRVLLFLANISNNKNPSKILFEAVEFMVLLHLPTYSGSKKLLPKILYSEVVAGCTMAYFDLACSNIVLVKNFECFSDLISFRHDFCATLQQMVPCAWISVSIEECI